MDELQQLKNEIEKIQERNARVEADKAWETSWTRRILIAVLTYIVIAVFFLIVGFQHAFLSALVPVTGFVLSTLSLSIAKNIWVRNKI